MYCYYCNINTHTTQKCTFFKKPDIDEKQLYQDILKNPEFDPDKHLEDKLTKMMYEDELWNSYNKEERRELFSKCADKKLSEITIKNKDELREIMMYYVGHILDDVKLNKFQNMTTKVIPYLDNVNQTYTKKLINIYLARDNETIVHCNVMF